MQKEYLYMPTRSLECGKIAKGSLQATQAIYRYQTWPNSADDETLSKENVSNHYPVEPFGVPPPSVIYENQTIDDYLMDAVMMERIKMFLRHLSVVRAGDTSAET